MALAEISFPGRGAEGGTPKNSFWWGCAAQFSKS